MGHLLNPKDKPQKEQDMFTKLEKWEKEVRAWETEFKRRLDEDTKISVVSYFFCPTSVQKFANLNLDTVDTYVKVRKLLIDYLESEDQILPELRLQIWRKNILV